MSATLNPDLIVSDLERSVKFYEGALDMKPVDRMSFFALLERPGFKLMMETTESPDPTTKGLLERQGKTPRATVNFWVTVEDVASEQKRLKSASVSFHGPVDKPYGYREVSFQDPDGYTWTLAQKLG